MNPNWTIDGQLAVAFSNALLTALAVSILIFATCMVTITWPCLICGKTNTTGIIKFLLCWCDHEPLR